MIEYQCPECNEPMSSPSVLSGSRELCPNCKDAVDVPDDETKTYFGLRTFGALIGSLISLILALWLCGRYSYVLTGFYLWPLAWVFLCFRREIQTAKGKSYYIVFLIPLALWFGINVFLTSIGEGVGFVMVLFGE